MWTHTHTDTPLPTWSSLSYRCSLLTQPISFLPSPAAHTTTHRSTARGARPYRPPVRMLPAHSTEPRTQPPDAPQPPGARGLWTRGLGLPVWKQGSWTLAQGASGCSGPSSGPMGQAFFSGLVRMAGPPWGGCLLLQVRPSAMRPSTGERLCTRSRRTLTELSPCFCLPPPPEGDASDGSCLPVVSVTAVGTQSCPLRAMSLLVWSPARDSGEDKRMHPSLEPKIFSHRFHSCFYIYIFCCRFNISTSLV